MCLADQQRNERGEAGAASGQVQAQRDLAKLLAQHLPVFVEQAQASTEAARVEFVKVAEQYIHATKLWQVALEEWRPLGRALQDEVTEKTAASGFHISPDRAMRLVKTGPVPTLEARSAPSMLASVLAGTVTAAPANKRNREAVVEVIDATTPTDTATIYERSEMGVSSRQVSTVVPSAVAPSKPSAAELVEQVAKAKQVARSAG